MSRGRGSPTGSESHSRTNKGAIKCITATRPSTTTIIPPFFFFFIAIIILSPCIFLSSDAPISPRYLVPISSQTSALPKPLRSHKSKVTTSSAAQLKNRIEIEAHLAMHWHARPTNPSSLPFYDVITWLYRITAPRAFLVLWSVQGIAVSLTLATGLSIGAIAISPSLGHANGDRFLLFRHSSTHYHTKEFPFSSRHRCLHHQRATLHLYIIVSTFTPILLRQLSSLHLYFNFLPFTAVPSLFACNTIPANPLPFPH